MNWEFFERDRGGVTEIREGDLAKLLGYVGHFINRPVLDEVSRRPKNTLDFSCDARTLNDARAEGKLDEAAILKHLTEQTGLIFTEKNRRVAFFSSSGPSEKPLRKVVR